MRRSVTFAAVLLSASVLPAVAACSSGGASTAAPVSTKPTDTSSPRNAETTSTGAAGFPTDSGSATAAVSTLPSLTLPACMIGSWVAPVSREFDHLGVRKQSDGAITGGTGMLQLELAANHGFSYTYQQVQLKLSPGNGLVNGPVTGTWTLTGNSLRTNVTGSKVTVKVTVAGIEVPSGVDDAMIRSFTPNDAIVTCTRDGLEMRMPTSQGGGTLTFDKA